ncbi:hypothetical protein [Candidatus Phytoplasma sp. AldY-WA1]|uniref:hypothetical protein n=1 Tax=Candidatus Phytoplasma sp. AldY-WA1 TaxID=2852100 RepID=UPI00254D5179|nr:hypothetical protein [Candidatus Phytoplasma sp. AldY-WA1]
MITTIQIITLFLECFYVFLNCLNSLLNFTIQKNETTSFKIIVINNFIIKKDL